VGTVPRRVAVAAVVVVTKRLVGVIVEKPGEGPVIVEARVTTPVNPLMLVTVIVAVPGVDAGTGFGETGPTVKVKSG